MLEQETIEKAWMQYLRYETAGIVFPREVQKERVCVDNLQTYIQVMRAYNGKTDCYVSLYSLPQIARGAIDTIFVDIDGSSFLDACEKLRKVCTILADYKYRVYWSGKKGFHVYIDFPLTVLRHPSLTIKHFLQPIKEYVDPHTRGNIRQMCRLPYTIHPDTGQRMVRVNPESPFESILYPRGEEGLAINDTLPSLLRRIDEKIKEEALEAPKIVAEIDLLPPCIVDMLVRVLETGDLTHQARLHLTAVLLWMGLSRGDIHSILRYARDYRPDTTEYQIRTIESAKLKGYSCIRLRELGLCPLEDLDAINCNFYPSINMYLLAEYGGVSPV